MTLPSTGTGAEGSRVNAVSDTPVVMMSFAPNRRFLACFMEGLVLTVVSSNFYTKVLDFDTRDGSGGRCLVVSIGVGRIEWCCAGEGGLESSWPDRTGTG